MVQDNIVRSETGGWEELLARTQSCGIFLQDVAKHRLESPLYGLGAPAGQGPLYLLWVMGELAASLAEWLNLQWDGAGQNQEIGSSEPGTVPGQWRAGVSFPRRAHAGGDAEIWAWPVSWPACAGGVRPLPVLWAGVQQGRDWGAQPVGIGWRISAELNETSFISVLGAQSSQLWGVRACWQEVSGLCICDRSQVLRFSPVCSLHEHTWQQHKVILGLGEARGGAMTRVEAQGGLGISWAPKCLGHHP